MDTMRLYPGWCSFAPPNPNVVTFQEYSTKVGSVQPSIPGSELLSPPASFSSPDSSLILALSLPNTFSLYHRSNLWRHVQHYFFNLCSHLHISFTSSFPCILFLQFRITIWPPRALEFHFPEDRAPLSFFSGGILKREEMHTYWRSLPRELHVLFCSKAGISRTKLIYSSYLILKDVLDSSVLVWNI